LYIEILRNQVNKNFKKVLFEQEISMDLREFIMDLKVDIDK